MNCLTYVMQECYTIAMSIKQGNKRVMITMPKDKYKKLKKISVDNEITLSELLMTACDTSKFVNTGAKILDKSSQ